MRDKELTYLDKCVFASLITFNGRGKIYPALKEIGNRINCNSVNNVSVSLNKLKKYGYIEIVRRFQKSNIYIINNIKTEMKIEKDTSSEICIEKSKPEDSIKFMDKAMIDVTVEQVAAAYGRSIPESSDHVFVNKLLKIKEKDEFKKDCMNNVRKCLMLLYLIKFHSDKFKNGNAYPYFQTVFSTCSYSDISKKIFKSGISNNKVSFQTGLSNSYK